MDKNPAWGERGRALQATLAFGIGIASGFGLGLIFFSEIFDFGIFLQFMAAFHMWEYFFCAMFHPNDLTGHSFLLDHSTAFYAAWAACYAEFFIENWLFSFKRSDICLTVGFFLCFFGQVCRTVSMYTAGQNFNHQIEEEARDSHKLVTSGIYSYLRHPSYFGWFWWCIGTQILLSNPICTAGFTFAAYNFFNDRIQYEEETLISMFGEDYKKYRAKVGTGIPFIK